jgi:chromosome segregation ATPase
MSLSSLLTVDRIFQLCQLLAQLISLLIIGWLSLRVERRLEDGERAGDAQAGRAARATEAIVEAQHAMVAAADGVATTRRALAALPPPATAQQAKDILAALESVRAMSSQTSDSKQLTANAQETERALTQERRLRGQLEGELSELRGRMEDRNRQINDMQRERRQLGNSATRAAGLEATNIRLTAELQQCRRESRELQARLQPMSLEMKALRSQLQSFMATGAQATDANSAYEAAVTVYQDQIRELEQRAEYFEDALSALQMEHLRLQSEKLFIEEHYLNLASD